MKTLDQLRIDYGIAGLAESDVDADPIVQFKKWFDEALSGGVREPNAMTLATASKDGAPSARVVLLKGVDARGFVFYTNYESDKGRVLAENPRAALVFPWIDLERQVRVEGTVTLTSRAETMTYFHSRPRGSQIAACASAQSHPLASRADLEARVAELTATFDGREVEVPEDWGGYRVSPTRIELWQGRPSRLHDRIVYVRDSHASAWKMQRLAP